LVEEGLSPFTLVKALEAHITSLVMKFDVDSLPSHERELLRSIKRLVVDVRLDLRDYGMADSKAAQDRFGREARQRLTGLEQAIVKASELNLFGAADVAHLSAQTQQVMTHL
jgi:hypothetical protein